MFGCLCLSFLLSEVLEYHGWLTFFFYLYFVISLVIETLKEVDHSRKCFRLVGGVLVERTVKEVLPALENNKEQVTGKK